MRSLPFLLASLLVPALAAQVPTNPVAYDQDWTDGSSGQLVPLGFSTSSTNFDEGRWQQLFPARLLPSSGGLITAIDFLPQMTMTTTYQSVQITLASLPAGTNALSSTFANNLQNAQVVYSQQNVTLNWVRRQWTSIQLQQPFFYDPTTDLVIDIQKLYDRNTNPPPGLAHHQTSSNPARSDLPRTMYSYSPLGGGGATMATALSTTGPLKMRLQFAGLPTQTLHGPANSPNNTVFGLGGTFDTRIYGFPGSFYATVVSVGFGAAPLTVPGISGAGLVEFGFAFTMISGVIDQDGLNEVTNIPIPNDGGLLGLNLTFQSISQASGGGFVFTNVADLIVNQ